MTAEEYARKIEKWSSIKGMNTHDFSGFILKAAQCDSLCEQVGLLRSAAKCSSKVAAILPGLISLVTAWFKSVGAKRACDYNAVAASFTWCGNYSVPYSTSDDNEAASEWNRHMSEVLSLIERKLNRQRTVNALRRKLDKACKATVAAADVDKDSDPGAAMRHVVSFVKELQDNCQSVKVNHKCDGRYTVVVTLKSNVDVWIDLDIH